MSTPGSDATEAADASVIGSAIVVINSSTLIWPLAQKVLTGSFSAYYEKLMWLLGLPTTCYMRFCGGEKKAEALRVKAREARGAARRAAGFRRAESLECQIAPELGVPRSGTDRVQARGAKAAASLVVADLESTLEPNSPRTQDGFWGSQSHPLSKLQNSASTQAENLDQSSNNGTEPGQQFIKIVTV